MWRGYARGRGVLSATRFGNFNLNRLLFNQCPPVEPHLEAQVAALSRKLPLILAVMACVALGPMKAGAYTLTGFRFDHLNITYSCGSPELQQAVQSWARVSALTDGGCSANPDITLVIVPNREWQFGDAAGVANGGHVWIKADYQHHLGVMTHEVGHALGMGHSAESFTAPYELRSAAMFYYCCNSLNADDIAGIVALYGPEPPAAIVPRAVSAMVASG